MVSLRFLIASIALLAVPLASAAPEPAETAIPEPVQVYGCFAGGVTVIILDEVELRCVGAPPATAAAAAEPVEQCGTVAYQVTVGPFSTSCITVVEPYACPGGGGYVVLLGKVQVGECRPCCEPVPATTAEAGQPVEIRQCDHWGNSVVLFGKIESPCITTGCSPTCATAAETAAPDPHLRTCNHHPRGVQLHNGDKAVGPCILLPDGGAQTASTGPLWGAEPCPEGEGSRLFVLGEQVTECGPGPATVDLRCTHPAYGVQVYVDGEPATRCIPLPHGV